ncbi:SocA family protein [Xenorhabdus sp. M]|uniref:SocA family protein n=1 Tax=Xenorhabdus szentirmaii TaxID=290112 RepID=A0AAW3YYW1_9GAMM|nr:Panacea domain-containing protein [Xenorhabdus sp. M]MBD2801423.1 SocA family protein [Xenorhabdus sp. M]
MVITRFDSEKALEAILYVASNAPNPDIYHIGKILYFADRKHLDRYGRLITGDTYIAMKDGPVASNTYDMIKLARGNGRYVPDGCDIQNIRFSLSVDGREIRAYRTPDDDVFSDSDIECIDEAIAEIGHLTFAKIRTMSHDSVWQHADENGEISIVSLAGTCRDSEKLIDYLLTGA